MFVFIRHVSKNYVPVLSSIPVITYKLLGNNPQMRVHQLCVNLVPLCYAKK